MEDTTENPQIRILLVDDHQIVLDGLKALLRKENQLNILAEASTGEEALQILETTTFDLIITDISMPGLSGLELTKQVKKKYPQIKILVLTMYNEESVIEEILHAEAEGYILKNTNKAELLASISKLMDGGTYYSPAVLQTLKNSNKNLNNINTRHLTEREVEIIQLIVQEYSTKQIADKLFISPRTVETHRKNIIDKTGVQSIVGLIKYAFHHALVV